MNGTLLLTDLRLATMDGDKDDPLGFVDDAIVSIVNGSIDYAGPTSGFDGDLSDAVSMDGRLAIPGLVACHCALCWVPGAMPSERLSGSAYRSLVRSTAEATSAADDATLLDAMTGRIERLRRCGVTTVELKSGFGLSAADEMRMSGLCRRLQTTIPVLSRVTLDTGGFVRQGHDADEQIAELETDFLPKIYEYDICDAIEVFCDDDAGLDLDQASTILEMFYRNKMPTRVGCDRFSDSAGATLPASFYSKAATYLCHSDDMGLESIADTGTVMVLVPETGARDEGDRIPLVDVMRRCGAQIAISAQAGPDGSGQLDLLAAARLAVDNYGLTAPEALRGITINAAKALGVNNQVGTVSPAKRGDLALFEGADPVDVPDQDACWGVVRGGVLQPHAS